MATFSTQLAHLLASHEKEQRDEGVMLIERWLASDHAFTTLDLLKAWKALFYCFWHSDKPLVQHELAKRLAKSQHVLRGHFCILYMGAFWTTMNREWGNIDRVRLDKFLAFVRYFLNESLQFIARSNYSTEAMSAVLESLSTGPLSPSEGTANGLRLHVADIYADELEKVFDDENFLGTSSERLVSMLAPFFAFAAQCVNRAVLANVLKSLFTNFTYKWREMLSNPPEEMDANTTSLLADKVTEHVRAFSNKLFEVASAQETSDISRPLLYKERKNLEKFLMDLERRGLKKRKLDDGERLNGVKASMEPPTKKQKRQNEEASPTPEKKATEEKKEETMKVNQAGKKEKGKVAKSAMKKAVASVLSPTLQKLLNEVGSDSDSDSDEDDDFEAMEIDEDDYIIHEDSDSSEDEKMSVKSKMLLKKKESDDEDSDDEELDSDEDESSEESDSGFDMEDDDEGADDDEELDEEGLRKLIMAMSKGGRKQPLDLSDSPRTPASAVFSRAIMTGTPPLAKSSAKGRKANIASAPSTPGSSKRVKFNLHANQSVDLEKIELGRSPYRPEAKPVSGILRTPGSTSKKTGNGAKKFGISNSTPVTPTPSSKAQHKKRPVAADFF